VVAEGATDGRGDRGWCVATTAAAEPATHASTTNNHTARPPRNIGSAPANSSLDPDSAASPSGVAALVTSHSTPTTSVCAPHGLPPRWSSGTPQPPQTALATNGHRCGAPTRHSRDYRALAVSRAQGGGLLRGQNRRSPGGRLHTSAASSCSGPFTHAGLTSHAIRHVRECRRVPTTDLNAIPLKPYTPATGARTPTDDPASSGTTTPGDSEAPGMAPRPLGEPGALRHTPVIVRLPAHPAVASARLLTRCC
jgi:hypothetical protein